MGVGTVRPPLVNNKVSEKTLKIAGVTVTIRQNPISNYIFINRTLSPELFNQQIILF